MFLIIWTIPLRTDDELNDQLENWISIMLIPHTKKNKKLILILMKQKELEDEGLPSSAYNKPIINFVLTGNVLITGIWSQLKIIKLIYFRFVMVTTLILLMKWRNLTSNNKNLVRGKKKFYKLQILDICYKIPSCSCISIYKFILYKVMWR